MKKIIAISLMTMVTLAPLGFAGAICDATGSDDYLTSVGAKIGRGIGNVAVSPVEIVRAVKADDNKVAGLGRGLVETVRRAVVGVIGIVTSIFPEAQGPQADPSCPTDLLTG